MNRLFFNRWPAGGIIFSLLLLGNFAVAQDNPKPANVYAASPTMPADLRRVLVLPLACEAGSRDLSGGCDMLNPVLQAALIKTGRFEVVAANPDALREVAGNASWTGQEILPQNFFSSLKDIYGCDAVLFCQLTEFRPNDPLAIGWRLKLVDAKTAKIVWASDEIYDAANAGVAKQAKKYEKSQQPHQSFVYNVYSFVAWCANTPTRTVLDDQWNILHSPRYFGAFTAENLLKTLPQR